MKSIAIVFVTIFFGISFAIPIKDHDIDELVLRVNELRRLNPYQGNQNKYLQSNGIGNIHRGKRAVDLERNPALYGYYAGVLNNIYDKRSYSESPNENRHSLERILLLQNVEPSDLTAAIEEPYGKRNFDEIDRALIGGLKKRLFSYRLPRLLNNYENNYSPLDVSSKRNFDEIDRAGFTTLKRNFDEIDKAGFASLKRSFYDTADTNRNPAAAVAGIGGSSLSTSAGLRLEKRA